MAAGTEQKIISETDNIVKKFHKKQQTSKKFANLSQSLNFMFTEA
jgi:hypothetical protein